jgi:hypothetical protein
LKLVGITPGSPGFEIKSLECAECEHTIVQRVAVNASADRELRPQDGF